MNKTVNDIKRIAINNGGGNAPRPSAEIQRQNGEGSTKRQNPNPTPKAQRRKQDQLALRQSGEEFKDLFDNAPVGFHEVDAEGRLLRINQTEMKMLGYGTDKLLPVQNFDLPVAALTNL